MLTAVEPEPETPEVAPWTPGAGLEERLFWKSELLALIPGAAIVRDRADRVVYWNRGAELLFGKSAAEALGKNMGDMTAHEKLAYGRAFGELTAHGEWSGELTSTAAKGGPAVIGHHWKLCPGDANRPDVFLAWCTDLTAQKGQEAETLRAKRLESIGALAGGVAHDLNNVLTPIIMAAPMLREDLPEDARQMIVETIEESANRGAEMVRQVLTFARGVEGERVLVQVGHLIKEATREVREAAGEKWKISTQVNTRGLWPVSGDAAQILDVLRKILANAREAMPEGGQLQLSADNVEVDENFASMIDSAQPGRYVAIRIADSGRGIPHPLLDRIFDPFFTTREQGNGSGLGLSSALGIVRSHGGFITAASQENKGSVFTIHLPRAHGLDDDASAEERALDAALPRGHGELVMIVDDEIAIRRVSARILEERGFRVLAAGDGTEALAKFAQARGAVRVVVTDLKMPMMDGMVLTRTLRQMDPAVRVIVSTGENELAQSESLREAGVVRTLHKPYTKVMLLQTVRETLDQAAAGSAV